MHQALSVAKRQDLPTQYLGLTPTTLLARQASNPCRNLNIKRDLYSHFDNFPSTDRTKTASKVALQKMDDRSESSAQIATRSDRFYPTVPELFDFRNAVKMLFTGGVGVFKNQLVCFGMSFTFGMLVAFRRPI